MKRFSFFRAPVSNVVPHKTVGIEQIYNVIRGDYYRAATEELRRLIQESAAAVRSLRAFMDVLERNPEALLRGKQGSRR